MPKVAVILFHLGGGHAPSKAVIDIINRSDVEGVSLIYASDGVKHRLTHNEKGIEVTTFPTFVIAEDDKPRRTEPGNKVNAVLEWLKDFSE